MSAKAPTEVLGRVLYDNPYAQGDVPAVIAGPAFAGFPPVFLFDYVDYSAMRIAADTATTTVEVTNPPAATLNHLGWSFRRLPDGVDQVLVRVLAENGGGHDNVHEEIITNANLTGLVEFADYAFAGADLRLDFEPSGAATAGKTVDIRQIVVGPATIFPRGQRSGLAKPNGIGSFKPTNSISINGSIVGRSVVRRAASRDIDLPYLDQAEVDTLWNPFALHALKKSFFWSWDLPNHPDEAVWAVAQSIVDPEQSDPPPFLRVEMPLRIIPE